MWKIVEIRKSQFFNFFSLKCEKTLKKHLKTWKGNNLVKKKKIGPVEKILVKKIGPQRVNAKQAIRFEFSLSYKCKLMLLHLNN